MAGKRYYFEALHREGGGGDNLAVGWQLPDATMERPIPGNRLSPATVLQPYIKKATGDGVQVFPTLVKRGQSVRIVSGKLENILLKLYNVEGKMVYTDRMQGTGDVPTDKLTPGMYIYNIRTDRQILNGKIMITE